MTWLLTAAAGRSQRGNSWGRITAGAKIVFLFLKQGQFFLWNSKSKKKRMQKKKSKTATAQILLFFLKTRQSSLKKSKSTLHKFIEGVKGEKSALY